MDISTVFYALTILHAGYLIQLSFRQPNSKIVSTKTESWPTWITASPFCMMFGRTVVVAIAIDQALVSLSLSHTLLGSDSVLRTICPTPQHIDPQLFTWSKSAIVSLVLLYLGSYIRLQAYAQLGTNFTYRIAKPDQLITSGLYAYVRHPSYTGLLMVLLATYLLFFRQQGLVSCRAPLVDWKTITDKKHAYLVFSIGFGFVICLLIFRRVTEEEAMLEGNFEKKWREYKLRTKKFIPYMY